MQNKDKGKKRPIPDKMSDIWSELLGNASKQGEATTSESGEATVPILKSDPWDELLQATGVETIDLQQLHLHMSDQDVEKALQIMQEQPLQERKRDQNSGL
jgi:hypothetical protein